MATQDFYLGDILSVTTSRNFSPRAFSGIRDVCSFMLGDIMPARVHRAQTEIAIEQCKPELLRQHPQLAGLEPPYRIPESWLQEQIDKYGEYLPVTSFSPDTKVNSSLLIHPYPDWSDCD